MERKRLYEAASTGNVSELLNLHQNDPLLVERVSYTCSNNTPLHIATLNNHPLFVEKILELYPHFSELLNSQQSSPLHIASAKGHLEIAKKLFDVAPHMCLSRDRQGRNPLHLAAIQGHVPVLEFLARRSPSAALERVDRGLTVLHLCVQHGKLDALKKLWEEVKVKDGVNNDGETILDMAKSGQHKEIIDYLNGAKPFQRLRYKEQARWIAKKRDTLVVVAILVATIAFQVGVNPPGGVWQDDSNDRTAKPYRAGESILAYNHPKAFVSFTKLSLISFISSLCTIFLLMSGLPCRRRIYMFILTLIFLFSIATIIITFYISVAVLAPKKHQIFLWLYVWIADAISLADSVLIGVIGFLLIVDMVYLFYKWTGYTGLKNMLGGRRAASVVEGPTSV